MEYTITLRSAQPADLPLLAALSADWAAEGNVYGYYANSVEDFAAQSCWVAEQSGRVVGYCCGSFETQERESSIMAKGTPCFELEELYVLPALRSGGIGAQIMALLEPQLRERGAEMLLLTAVNRDARRLLDFYEDKAGMSCWSARMFKKLSSPS